MTLFARIFSLLLLSTALLAQEAPEAPTAPAVPEKPVEAVELGNDADPQPPEWDPTTEPSNNEVAVDQQRDRNWNRERHGHPYFGQDIVVRPNETVRELVLIGGSADIQGEVERDVVVIGGSLKVSGKVGGDVVVIGGKGDFSGEVDGDTVVVLGRSDVTSAAHLHGDAVFVGGPATVAPEASILGERVTVPIGDFLPHIEWAKAYFVRGPLLGRWLTFQMGWPWAIAGTFLAIYLGMLLVFPAAARSVYSALEQRPVTSIFTGLLTLILFAPLTFLLVISVAGIVVVPFLKIALLLALLFGKVGVLCFLGRGFARTAGMTSLQVPFLAFVIGAIVLTLSYAVPFFGIFAWAMATVFGLGGAIVALCGTYKREEAKVPPAAVLVSTIRPGHQGPVSTGTAPAASEAIPGATIAASGVAAAAAIPPELSNLNPQDTLLLPRVGFWKRFLAAMLDLFLVSAIIFIIPGGPALFIPLAVVYFAGMWTWRGTTFGGLVLGHKVVRTDGGPVTFSVAIVRSLLSIFSGIVFFLGFLWAAWDPEKQTWHDKIAGTVVVKMPAGFALI